MQDLLDYATSPLNPALKLIIALVFLLVIVLYYWGSRQHGGKVRAFVLFLVGFATFFFIASVLRYFGHGTDFGFTNDFSLKWFQSIGYVIGSIIFILAALALNNILSIGDNKGTTSLKQSLRKLLNIN